MKTGLSPATLRECAALLDKHAEVERRECGNRERMCPWHRWRHDMLVEVATDWRTKAIRAEQEAR